jgi:hypothetical protein
MFRSVPWTSEDNGGQPWTALTPSQCIEPLLRSIVRMYRNIEPLLRYSERMHRYGDGLLRYSEPSLQFVERMD